MPAAVQPLTEAELAQLQALMDGIPDTLEPLDVVMIDGYLCGVLLQPVPLRPEQLRTHALLMFATGSGRTEWTLLPPEPGGAVQRIERRGGAPTRLRAISISLLLQACLAGLGIARLPLHTVQAQAAGLRVPVLPTWTPQPVPRVWPVGRRG